MGKIIAYCREGCFYSNNTKSILLDINSLIRKTSFNSKPNNNLEIIINSVPNTEREKNNVKQSLKHLIGNHSTFPIVIYETSNGHQYFIGGDSDLVEIMNFVDTFNNNVNITDLSSCLSENTLNRINPNLNEEGKKRLICNLLLLKNKITI